MYNNNIKIYIINKIIIERIDTYIIKKFISKKLGILRY